MRIHALLTGQVVLKQSFLHPRPGLRRRVDLLLPGRWSEPMPIRAWLIEHGEERILIDMGETAKVRDAPFARHTVAPQDELPLALHAVGLACEDVSTAVVTHLHPDHFHGAVHLRTSVLVNEAEWADATSLRGRVIQRLTGVSLPGGIDFRPVALHDGPFGAFAASRQLTTDGRVLLVSTPGHTRGHASVIAVDDDSRHVLGRRRDRHARAVTRAAARRDHVSPRRPGADNRPHPRPRRRTPDDLSADARPPKGTDLTVHSAVDLDWVATELNDRPHA